MYNQDNSQSVRAGSITYFFDVKETRERKPYLMITMSRFKGEGEDWDRVSLPLFPEHDLQVPSLIQSVHVGLHAAVLVHGTAATMLLLKKRMNIAASSRAGKYLTILIGSLSTSSL